MMQEKTEAEARARMDDSLVDRTCKEFARDLAAKRSVPGGGGAAAYVGALGVALGEMTGNFTIGKARYADYQHDVERLLAESAEIRARLIELVDADAKAFEPLSQAYAIPKEDPGRSEIIERATKDAVQAPLEMMRHISRAIEVLDELKVKGSRMLLSDVGCGALMCRAALESAALNVAVNTRSLSDRSFASEVDEECGRLLEHYVKLAQDVVGYVREQMA